MTPNNRNSILMHTGNVKYVSLKRCARKIKTVFKADAGH